MNKSRILVIIFIIIAMVTTGCQSRELNSNERSEYKMDTLVQIKIYTDRDGDREILDQAFNILDRLESKMSTTIEDSELNRINRQAGQQKVQVSQDTMEVLTRAQHYAEISGGIFDPTIGPLVELWNIGGENPEVPPETAIQNQRELIDYQKLQLNPDQGLAFLKEKDMQLDLGGIAKGYAADRVIDYLRKQGIKHAYINIGGNVSVLGSKPDTDPWRIGIQDPDTNRGRVMAALEITDKTVVTSGNYERFFEEDGQRYHHILNPDTGYPAQKGIISSTVIADQSIKADALATIFFIAGLEKTQTFLEKMPEIEAMFITDDNSIFVTEGLKESLEITSPDTYSQVNLLRR